MNKDLRNLLISIAGRIILSPLKLLPINHNRVLFVSHRGKQYSCNPRYISEALNNTTGIERIWAFHEPERFAYLSDSGVTVMSDRGFKFLLAAMTARVIVTNTYYKPFLPRRKDQFYLRTWHGGGAYKRVNYPKGIKGAYIRMEQEGASLYLSSSRAFTQQTLREAFNYTGAVLEQGMPRNDILIRGADAGFVRKRLGIVPDVHVALYAPTYRDAGISKALYPDCERLKQSLRTRFGGEWLLLFRGHTVFEGITIDSAGDMDVFDYPDMQELLLLADVLITDYSSSMWDMSLTKKPVFLYCADLNAYRSERDFFTDIHSWGFPVAENDAELERNILEFNEAEYSAAMDRHHAELGSYETGHAAEAAANAVMRALKD